MIRFLVAIAGLGACSFGMQGIDPKWDGTSEPNCDDSVIVLDRIVGLGLLTAGVATVGPKQEPPNLLVGGVAIAMGLVYELSAVIGSKAFTQCQVIRRRWMFSNAIKAREPTRSPGAPPAASRATGPRPSRPATAAPDMQPVVPGARRPWAEGVSDADQAAALTLHAAGNHEFVQAHYLQALAKYRAAIRYWDHPAIRFNMAVCLINLDDPVEAKDNLEQSLIYGASALGPDSYAQGLTYRKLLDDKLVRLTLDCPEPGEEVLIDGKLVFTGPGVVDRFLLPGEHQIVATKPGFLSATRKIVLVAGKPASYEIRPVIDPRPRP